MFLGDPNNQGALIKMLIAAIIGSGIGLAVKKLANHKITLSTAILSFCIGIGLAYLLHTPIQTYIDETWQTFFIGAVAITGEKIGYFFVFRLKVDKIIDSFFETLFMKYKKK